MAFPLHPETPDEGCTLEQLFAGRNFDIPAMWTRLKEKADELGLAFGERSMTYNSRRAQELGKWADTQGKGDEFHMAMFLAYFRDGLNLAQIPVLQDICVGLGLDPAEAERVITEKTYAQAVDDDWQRSRAMGVTAVPTFAAGRQAVAGAQPYNALKALIKAAQDGGIVL